MVSGLLTRVFKIRNRSELPFYCDPVLLFLAVWLLMLSSFELHISYTSYPDLSLALAIFAYSLISFLAGYLTVRAAYFAVNHTPRGCSQYRIDTTRLRRFHLVSLVIAVAIIIFNWSIFGRPPIFGFFGADTLYYTEYGSFRQMLFAAIMVLFVSAPLEPSRARRWFLYCFCVLSFLAYASRGYLLIMLFQSLIVFSLRTNLSRKKIYLIALFTLACAVGISNVIGNGRNSLGSEALFAYMQIKHSYYSWPAACVWMISYISTPISNLCWIVKVYHYDHSSLSFLSSMLPGFWTSPSSETADLGSEMIVDGVHTYIAKYFLDFSYLGMFLINYVWGLIGGCLNAGNRLSRNYLTSAVLLGCIGFMFFADFLTILIILLELGILALGQKYFTVGCDATHTI